MRDRREGRFACLNRQDRPLEGVLWGQGNPRPQCGRKVALRSCPQQKALAQASGFQVFIGLNDLAQTIFARPVAAIGVRVVLLHQRFVFLGNVIA